MKRSLIFATAVVFSSGAAFAQAAITITPELETEFRTYVTTQEVEPVDVDTEIVIGTALPDTVVLQPVPDVIVTKAPDFEGYRYAVVSGHVVIVDPDSTEVVAVIAE